VGDFFGLRSKAGVLAVTDVLPAELERRIAALESGEESGADFDAVSWCWMILFGIVLPVCLLLWGWFG
jgi:hypothetical protein